MFPFWAVRIISKLTFIFSIFKKSVHLFFVAPIVISKTDYKYQKFESFPKKYCMVELEDLNPKIRVSDLKRLGASVTV